MKGQVSIFLIIGIVILAIAALLVTLYTGPLDTNHAGHAGISNYVESCAENSLAQALHMTALKGGKINPEPAKNFYTLEIPYYWNGQNHMPEISRVENSINHELRLEMEKCLDNFSVYKNQGYSIITGELRPKTKLLENRVRADINFPLNVKQGNTTKRIENFQVFIDSDFKKAYDTLKQIMDEQEKTPDSVPIGYISYLADEHGFSFQTINMQDESEVFFSFTFPGQNNPLVFNYFANYSWQFNSTGNIEIEQLPVYNITEEYIFEKKISANGTNLTFSDSSDAFDISEDGLVRFNTTKLRKGITHHMITVEDGDNKARTYISFNSTLESKKPRLAQIGRLKADKGERFIYHVKAENPGDWIAYLEDTSLFDINVKNGTIDFTPQMKGNFTIKITAVNTIGHDYEYMELEVK